MDEFFYECVMELVWKDVQCIKCCHFYQTLWSASAYTSDKCPGQKRVHLAMQDYM